MAQALPRGAYLNDISAHYNHLTIPRSLRHDAPVPPEIWVRVVVEEGSLRLFIAGASQAMVATVESDGLIPGGAKFRVEVAGSPVRFYLEYYHVAQIDDGAKLAGMLSRAPARKTSSSR